MGSFIRTEPKILTQDPKPTAAVVVSSSRRVITVAGSLCGKVSTFSLVKNRRGMADREPDVPLTSVSAGAAACALDDPSDSTHVPNRYFHFYSEWILRHMAGQGISTWYVLCCPYKSDGLSRRHQVAPEQEGVWRRTECTARRWNSLSIVVSHDSPVVTLQTIPASLSLL